MGVSTYPSADDLILDPFANLKESCAKNSNRDSFFLFIIDGVLLNSVALFGIFGNAISMIILSQPQMRSSINFLLISLACCDTVFIITSALLYGFSGLWFYGCYMFKYYHQVYALINPYVFPILRIAQTMSVYLTVLISFERYIVVCHPLRARSICTIGRAKICLIVTFIFALIYNLPRFWEYTYSAYTYPQNATVYFIKVMPLRNDKSYANIYLIWLYYIFIFFVPFILLAILNALIYKKVRQANAERQKLSPLQRHEIKLATMLICVVLVFFVCYVLDLVFRLGLGRTNNPLNLTNHLLETINSSVNVIIYLIFFAKFRQLFLRMFCSLPFLPTSDKKSSDAVTGDRNKVTEQTVL